MNVMGALAAALGLTYNTLVVLVGVGLLGASAGMIGCFATLRRRALTGDALAHAALPGLGLAYLVVGERNLFALLIGALATGWLGILTIGALRRWTRIKEDAAIGIVLSVFFAGGVVLLQMIQRHQGNKAGLNSYILGRTAGMIAQDVYLIAGVALLNLLIVLLLYKEFKLICFDPSFAQVQGWPAMRIDLLLMTLIAIAVVIGLPAVGVVLIAALLILPGASARFWTDRLSMMLLLATLFGLATGSIGVLLSDHYVQLPAGPVIVLVGATLFGLSVLLAPRRGVIGRWISQRRFRDQLEQQKLLQVFFDLLEPGLPSRCPVRFEIILQQRSWTPGNLKRLLKALQHQNLVQVDSGSDSKRYALTDSGLRRAAEVARGYRLWQLFLTEYADQAGGTANLATESVDRLLPPPVIADLTAKLRAAGRLPWVGVGESTP